MLEKLNPETGKNVLLLVAIVGILVVDTLISQHIFSSLGLYSKEWLKLGEWRVNYATIYAFFITAAVAFSLHMVWPRKKFKAQLAENRWTMLGGLCLLVVLFIIRVATVVNSDWAQQLMEVVILTAWLIGVVIVYWLVGEILGDDPDWFKLVVAIGIPIVLSLLVLGGSLLILGLLFDWLIKAGCEVWLGLRKARTTKQETIARERLIKNKGGFYRGFNF